MKERCLDVDERQLAELALNDFGNKNRLDKRVTWASNHVFFAGEIFIGWLGIVLGRVFDS